MSYNVLLGLLLVHCNSFFFLPPITKPYSNDFFIECALFSNIMKLVRCWFWILEKEK